MLKLFTISIISIVTLLTSLSQRTCNKPKAQQPIVQFKVPEGFPTPQYNFTNNAVTEQGFYLGKKIFYDNQLSSDGQVSCANCHQQFASFVMYDHDLAHGVNDQHSTRNPQPLINLAWHKEYMWDGGITNLEVQPLAPFTASNEMNISLPQIITKLQADTSYTAMFANAYGDTAINSQRILKAITQYLVMLVSANSQYDKYIKGRATFNELEKLGYQVFKNKCNNCHTEPLFTDLSYRNIGLPISNYLVDVGRMKITNNRADSLKFKVPTLRNAALTMPYTHDGRIGTLDLMIDHYRHNVVNDFSTDSLVRKRIAISNTEKTALVAFIKTLTDTAFTKNKLFAK